MAIKKCPACGRKISSGAYYCIYCGHVFEEMCDPGRKRTAPVHSNASRTAAPTDITEKKSEKDHTMVFSVADTADDMTPLNQTFSRQEAWTEETEKASEGAQEMLAGTDEPVDIFTRREKKPAVSAKKPSAHKWQKWLIVFLIAAVFLTVVLVVILLRDDAAHANPDSFSTTVSPPTAPTRDAARDAWLNTFAGEWVDEQSTGKGNIPIQGGGQLTIYSIEDDRMAFDLISYSGGDAPTVASLIGGEGKIEDKRVTFCFEDDGLGNRGEGYMLLSDNGIDIEITLADTVTGEDGIPQIPTHSLAMNAHFARISLPSSNGCDVRQLDTLEKVEAVAGEQTADPVKNADDTISYAYGMLQVTAAADGMLKNIRVDYSVSEEKSRYCYDCVDGTMDYEVIKTYFGEAEYDYTEQPTDIRVLYYLIGGTQTVTFTFDAQDNLLMDILFTR